MKKTLYSFIMITPFLFIGCDLVNQFLAENKDLFINKSSSLDSMTDNILSEQEVLLTQEKNNGIASNIDNQDDNLAPGSFKIAWYAGGKALKKVKREKQTQNNTKILKYLSLIKIKVLLKTHYL